jgi:tetratricopeptide (TPR) repeat protein
MKALLSTISFCTTLVAFPLYSSAQEASRTEDAGSSDVVPQWQKDFETLGSPKQTAYRDKLKEAGRLFNQKRIIEALNELAEAQRIFPNEPGALNLVGACHVEFRNFRKARAAFEEALKLQSDYIKSLEVLSGEARARRIKPVLNIMFNLVEMDFVTSQWGDCAGRIESLLPDMDPSDLPMIRLLEFKYLLCKLKLGKVDEARTLAQKYDFRDDYPYYYYANAALAYHDEDESGAERWRGSARRVFRRPSTLAAWEDTMIEIGFVKSFYGGAK